MKTRNPLRVIVFSLALIIVLNSATGQGSIALKIGDPAPPMKYSKWLKGEPDNSFDPSKLYVLEFWATWCGPCKMAMPHITKLQKQYQGKVDFIGVDVWEKVPEGKPYETCLPMVEKFVKGNDVNMGYAVVVDNNDQFMGNNWLKAAGENGIPSTFIVQNNKVIWIGHPNSLDSTLPTILDGSYKMEEFAAVFNKKSDRSRKQAEEVTALIKPVDAAIKAKDYQQAFALMEEAKAKMPMLTMVMNGMKFKALLDLNEDEAIGFGKQWQAESKGAWQVMIGEVYTRDGLSKNTYLWVAQISEAGATEANPILNHALAACYAKGGDHKTAVMKEEKAVEGAKAALKEGKMIGSIMDYTVVEYEKALEEYKKMIK